MIIIRQHGVFKRVKPAFNTLCPTELRLGDVSISTLGEFDDHHAAYGASKRWTRGGPIDPTKQEDVWGQPFVPMHLLAGHTT